MADPADDLNLQGIGTWTTFVYYFTCTTLLIAFVTSQGLHLSLATPAPYRYGLLLGVPAGLLGVYFNRTVVWQTPVENVQAFQSQLEQALADIGFDLVATPQTSDYRVYTRPAFGNFLSQRIRVQFQAGQAAIAGRAAHLRRLRAKL